MRAFLVVALLLAFALAGCLGGDDEVGGEGDGSEPIVTGETGSLRGQVMGEDLLPLTEAIVTLGTGTEVVVRGETRADGGYTLNNIAPGTYRVQASHQCCLEQARTIEIRAGEVTTQNFLLAEIGDIVLRVPWVEGPLELKGFMPCSIFGVPACQFDSNDAVRFTTLVDLGVKTITAGLVWEPAGVMGADEFTLQLHISHGNFGPGQTLLVEGEGGPNGFEVQLDESFFQSETFEFTEDTPWELEFRILVPVGESQIVYQQPYDLWYTFHYWDPAPAGFSTLPG